MKTITIVWFIFSIIVTLFGLFGFDPLEVTPIMQVAAIIVCTISSFIGAMLGEGIKRFLNIHPAVTSEGILDIILDKLVVRPIFLFGWQIAGAILGFVCGRELFL